MLEREAAAEAAALRVKLKYIEIEAQQSKELEKITILKEFETAEAKQLVMNNFEYPDDNEMKPLLYLPDTGVR